MTQTITFLHTSPVHIATFERLLDEANATISVRHIVDERLLDDARVSGITADLTERMTQVLGNAAVDTGIVVCTCSTIGGAAEQIGVAHGWPVVRVDRAMAERAVLFGERITVVAALSSTLPATHQLLLEAAGAVRKQITVHDVVCEAAWTHFERGDHDAYLTEIAACIRGAAPQGDVIVLAQASMAGAAALCADLALPILSSPQLGLSAALQALAEDSKG